MTVRQFMRRYVIGPDFLRSCVSGAAWGIVASLVIRACS